MKKFIALLLTIATMLSILTVSVYADKWEVDPETGDLIFMPGELTEEEMKQYMEAELPIPDAKLTPEERESLQKIIDKYENQGNTGTSSTPNTPASPSKPKQVNGKKLLPANERAVIWQATETRQLYPPYVFENKNLSTAAGKEVTMTIFDAVSLGYIKEDSLPASEKAIYKSGKREFHSLLQPTEYQENIIKIIDMPCVTFEKRENDKWYVKQYNTPQMSIDDAISLGFVDQNSLTEKEKKFINMGAFCQCRFKDGSWNVDIETFLKRPELITGMGLKTQNEIDEAWYFGKAHGGATMYGFDMENNEFMYSIESDKKGIFGSAIYDCYTGSELKKKFG